MYLVLYRKKVPVGAELPPFTVASCRSTAELVRALVDLACRSDLEYLVAENLETGRGGNPQVHGYGRA